MFCGWNLAVLRNSGERPEWCGGLNVVGDNLIGSSTIKRCDFWSEYDLVGGNFSLGGGFEVS